MSVTVRPVAGRRDFRHFVELPYELRRDDPQWVPQLRFERRQFLDRKRNPYFQHAEGEYFLAERDGRIVGRIAAHFDRRWDEFQGGNDGMWGFFECEDDAEAATALFDAARAWIAGHGRERMLGPLEFTTNDECGLLISGYDEPTMILEPWHPPYYRALVEAQGLSKAMDLQMWETYFGELPDAEGNRFAPVIHKAAARAKQKGVVIRPLRKRDLANDVATFMEIYNEAWGHNWGFVPITRAEVDHQAKNLKPILDERWAMMAEYEGEAVGAALTLLDINQVLARMGGRLLPLGWWHFLRRRRYIDRLRVFALGVRPAYQHLGVAAALYEAQMNMAAGPGPLGGHMGWILENNKSMNRGMEAMGGEVVKVYRIYEGPVQAEPEVGVEP